MPPVASRTSPALACERAFEFLKVEVSCDCARTAEKRVCPSSVERPAGQETSGFASQQPQYYCLWCISIAVPGRSTGDLSSETERPSFAVRGKFASSTAHDTPSSLRPQCSSSAPQSSVSFSSTSASVSVGCGNVSSSGRNTFIAGATSDSTSTPNSFT